MPASKEDNGLNTREQLDLALQSGLQLVPFGIGASISAIYFGVKQERRFKRIEEFYQEIANELRKLGDDVQKIKAGLDRLNENDQAAFAAILEELNEKVEREHVRRKIDFLRHYLLNTMIAPVSENNFDERRFFLDTVGSISLIECDLLVYLYNYEPNKRVHVKDIVTNNTDQYAIIGSVTRLKSYGFVRSFTMANFGAEQELIQPIEISPFGRRFYEFCIKS